MSICRVACFTFWKLNKSCRGRALMACCVGSMRQGIKMTNYWLAGHPAATAVFSKAFRYASG